MTQKELSKYEIIKNLISKTVNGSQAAKQLGLSVRQVKRLKREVINNGAIGLINKGRGRKGNRRIKPEILEKVKKYLKEKYHDFGPKFASEKLLENHQIKLDKETIRVIMITENLWIQRSRKTNKEYRSWRPRKDNYGEMQQFDGSYHNWFEGRNEKVIGLEQCLLASIDDATGRITKAYFDYHEGITPVFNFWKDYLRLNNKPLSIYLDKFSTYKINHKAAVDNQELMTQFQRAMKDLGINLITAHSPQAKGRIERLFKTLQDRLVKEMRLAGILTIEEANKFLVEVFIPKFNQQFSVVPEKQGDLHRELTSGDQQNIDKIFSIQDTRIVNNDFTINFKTHWLQLNKTQPTLVIRKSKVLIEQRLDGSIRISLRSKYLGFKELPERPKKIKDLRLVGLTITKPSSLPSKSNPWDRSSIIENQEKNDFSLK